MFGQKNGQVIQGQGFDELAPTQIFSPPIAAGADDEMIALIEAAWLEALAERDPAVADFGVELPDEAWVVVDAATVEFSEALVPFAVDPTLITEVETPLTDGYLAVSCPDRGTLSGQEVDPDATTP